jgi:hypothetical protein
VRDDLHVVRFHAKEQSEGRTFRWSRDASCMTITSLRANNREVTLWLSDGGRPAGAPPADVSVFLDNEPIGDARGYWFQTVCAGDSSVVGGKDRSTRRHGRIEAHDNDLETRAALGTADHRDLGVMVDRVAIE